MGTDDLMSELTDIFGFTTVPTTLSREQVRKNEATFMGTAGMGDMILLAPAAVYALQYYETVYFPSKVSQEKSIRDFFKNYKDRIIIYLLTNKVVINGYKMLQYEEKDYHGDLLGCGVSPMLHIDPNVSFAANYYDRLGIPYSARWDFDPLPEAAKTYGDQRPEKDEYTFVHHDVKRGYTIKERYLSGNCVYPDQDEYKSILSYAPAIKNANRIKVIDSSFLHLCESLPTRPDAELEYHKYARPLEDRTNDADVPTRKNWKIIRD